MGDSLSPAWNKATIMRSMVLLGHSLPAYRRSPSMQDMVYPLHLLLFLPRSTQFPNPPCSFSPPSCSTFSSCSHTRGCCSSSTFIYTPACSYPSVFCWSPTTLCCSSCPSTSSNCCTPLKPVPCSG